MPTSRTSVRECHPKERLYARGVGEDLSMQELEAMHCWEAADRVPGRPAMTEFRRRLRYHQARWREMNGHPVGSQPIAPIPGGGSGRLVGTICRSPTLESPVRTSSPHTRSTRRGRERRSSSVNRASITSGCGPISCHRRRSASTCSVIWPPTSRVPTGPSTRGSRTCPAP